jgi:hypothetical protein
VTSAGSAGLEMTAIEFERHGGWGTYKKWKRSITVSTASKQCPCKALCFADRHQLDQDAVHVTATADVSCAVYVSLT